MRIILASESPRRKEIMNIMGIPCETMAANVLEVVEETKPSDMVQALAAKKVKHIAKLLEKDKNLLILGADTMVFFHEHALGKPKNEEDAVRMLQMLSGHVHEVYTGVCIIIKKEDGKEKFITFSVCTKVTVQPLTMQQIKDYIATGEPMDKAGAYAIQGKFGIHIKQIDGDYYNVVGFPIAGIYEKLLEEGINIKNLN